ncbi:Na+-transporting NADH:ubiquinone oxidoreductase subunit D [Proteiniborus sp. DW1]|uniref:NADH:ubiquinone reductase (Na(+)-transporting) subunit D n=1 Tax=Proteiniborus sp. DW1 TaxID=1889883 RepID=UPI00092E1B20|nr:NADH:ubiquinone reductase (Na(+)-transporting) subunit D [Proteiniborus sp. DW1]SCG84583.1 Na+-transporting NADH:ubiquinone oxidoreductase subunit D [Proteiniborus sp. DW1]
MAGDSPKKIFIMGLWKDNPVFRQIIGICSALAVTNLMLNSLIMGLGLIFVTAFSELTISIIRSFTPKHIRMMIQVLIISVYVIIVDIVLKAYYPEMSKALGPYVGLIITNCIIMGRCEAYAQKNPPLSSFLDGIASGAGYTLVLLAIAFVRELLGFGTIFGVKVLGDWWTNWTIMIMPPGAFFVLAVVIWIARSISSEDKEKEKEVAKA